MTQQELTKAKLITNKWNCERLYLYGVTLRSEDTDGNLDHIFQITSSMFPTRTIGTASFDTLLEKGIALQHNSGNYTHLQEPNVDFFENLALSVIQHAKGQKNNNMLRKSQKKSLFTSTTNIQNVYRQGNSR